MNNDLNQKWRDYQNYIIIAILSIVSIFFLPMLGSEVGLGWKVPNTTAGWVVFIVTKLSIVTINILMLDQFIKQAKVNVKDDERFIEADTWFTLQLKSDEDEGYYDLPSPKEYLSKLYKNKGVTSLITSTLSVFGFTQAILSFDWVSMLTYLFTIVIGLIFGWITMNNVEEYWTTIYYKRYLQEKKKNEKEGSKGVLKEENGYQD